MDGGSIVVNAVFMVLRAFLGVWIGAEYQKRLNRISEQNARRNLRARLREAIQFNADFRGPENNQPFDSCQG